MLGLDTWADTCCMGKHAHVREIIEGKTVSASGFAATLPTVNDIPIANCSLAYDALNGTTYILEVNNALYLGDTMDHCLLCPNQCEDNGIRMDLRPAYYYPNDRNASTLYSKEANLNIPIQHKGPLPFFNVRRPTQNELASCDVVQLTSIHEWDPYDIGYHLFPIVSQMQRTSCYHDVVPSVQGWEISNQLSHVHMYNSMVSSLIVDYNYEADEVKCISALATRKRDKLSPEQLMKLWHIGYETAKRTLGATTHQCIRSLEDIRRRFRTDKAHLRYKRLSESRHGKFYVDTLFSKVKSIRGYTCGNIFTNTLGFKKFFPLRTES